MIHDEPNTNVIAQPQGAEQTGSDRSDKQQQKNTTGETAGKWSVLAIVAVGVFMATLDSSIVNISLPAIASSFGVPLSGLVEWVIIAYLVVTAAVLVVHWASG